MFGFRSIAVVTLLVATPLFAHDNTARVDSIFNFATAQTPGCAAGVSDHGKVIVNKYYGLADLDKRTPLNASSLFDIGSTQKQFTATSMLLLGQDGNLSLSDDIRPVVNVNVAPPGILKPS